MDGGSPRVKLIGFEGEAFGGVEFGQVGESRSQLRIRWIALCLELRNQGFQEGDSSVGVPGCHEVLHRFAPIVVFVANVVVFGAVLKKHTFCHFG